MTDGRNKMRTNLRYALAAAAAAAVILASCEKGQPAAQATTERPAVPVETVTLEGRPFESYLQVTGTVKARSLIQVVAEEGGILREIRTDKGQPAEANAVLARLENQALNAALAQAVAALRQAELDASSRKVLFEKKAIPENEYLASGFALDAARASSDLARTRADKLTIRAPIGGLVNARFVDLGAYVTPMSPVFELIDLERVRIVAGVAERHMSSVAVGTPARVTFDAYPLLAVDARVSYVSRKIDPANRTFDVEIEIANPDRKLAPDMVANVRIRSESLANRIVVPIDALVESEDGWHVFVEEGSRARKVKVTKLDVYQDSVLVDGLESGQRLITTGQQSLTDGDAVAVTNT
jgi:membrane fusion protein (multidrug efflux system)